MNTSCSEAVSSNALSFLVPFVLAHRAHVSLRGEGRRTESCCLGLFPFCSWWWNSGINCMDLTRCGTRKGNLQNPNQKSNLATMRKGGTGARLVSEDTAPGRHHQTLHNVKCRLERGRWAASSHQGCCGLC